MAASSSSSKTFLVRKCLMVTSINSKWIRDERYWADTSLQWPRNHHSQKKRKNQFVTRTLKASGHHWLLAAELRKIFPYKQVVQISAALEQQQHTKAILRQGGSSPGTPVPEFREIGPGERLWNLGHFPQQWVESISIVSWLAMQSGTDGISFVQGTSKACTKHLTCWSGFYE